MKLKVSTKGFARTRAKLAKMKKLLSGNLDFALKPVGIYLTNFVTRDVFATEGQVIGEPWPELSEGYLNQKVKEYPGRGILEREGDLRYSFEYDTPKKNQLRVFSDNPYGKFHQSDAPRTVMPQRKMLKLDRARADRVRRMVGTAVRQKLKSL